MVRLSTPSNRAKAGRCTPGKDPSVAPLTSTGTAFLLHEILLQRLLHHSAGLREFGRRIDHPASSLLMNYVCLSKHVRPALDPVNENLLLGYQALIFPATGTRGRSTNMATGPPALYLGTPCSRETAPVILNIEMPPPSKRMGTYDGWQSRSVAKFIEVFVLLMWQRLMF